ncbi:TetR/AcrR family transcriptional regulator [Herbiconiux daphne]|uniref:TetR/AcrR family transcriptional regulator n=1 Tax=Herbiconiux daphne TaxID=2970914 RepID=A0ABT2H197_9MICO|nr:TetR/AcrR family transcriptional regulator [Herbiconiux daphne]MCS5733713.1 TetR/AcrR family transcriptional regulator [Herbiconiux daphne]
MIVESARVEPPDAPRRVDPRQVRSRALVLDAATEHFVRHGYIGTNLDTLAADAGVSKRTVYNLFRSKDELFHAVIGRVTEIAEQFVSDHLQGEVGARPVDVELREFAVAHGRAVLAPRVIATRRLLIGEAERFPQLAADYYERVPGRVMAAIAERLARYHSAGLLNVPHPDLAADQFAFLVLGSGLDRALFDPSSLNDASTVARALAGADAFYRAYRAN